MTDLARPPLDDVEREYLAAAATGTALSFWAARRPATTAVTDTHREVSFAELDADANRIARLLRDRGLRPGDGICVLLPNSVELVAVYQAAIRTGLRFTPVNWHLTGDEVAYVVADSGARALVAHTRFAPAAEHVRTAATDVRTWLSVGGPVAGHEPLGEAIARHAADPVESPSLGRYMFYTSGTTGRPKGVLKPVTRPTVHLMHGTSAPQPHLPPPRMQPGISRHLCTGPLYHSGPLGYAAVALGAGVGTVVMDRWSAEETLRLIDLHRISHSHMVPTMFHRMLVLPAEVRRRYDVSSLVQVWHGAAPCPVAVKQAMIDWWGPVLCEYYAATEGTGTSVSSEDWLRRPGTVGRAEPGHVRILDDDGVELPPGHTGTIYLRSPETGRFSYFGSPEKTSDSHRGDHFTVGDIGHLDEDGYLFVTDRSADLIISGGVNIYPAEVEQALLTHPGVGDVAVIGEPDPDWGESVLALVEPSSRAGPGFADELIAFCRDRIAHYKCPRRVVVVDRLPRNDAGKIEKLVLRAEHRRPAEEGAQG
ncbi:putative acyl-CoA ligase [Pseudonocardia sulfidoxydans NBRC 16205]|uniref:Putative acyl-CoA ligase n=1 Tax=Pseudonocardia sulfidoxydans NBRC 16205 TaxID=1223511 RepID=A0A511DS21_9PSEU|nr:AMP-binding protein [Pseudonocardia sulfidoxydans]GEL26544.1 putative acyl-CoA ligase [Pseudonocardia sulfidoxydans NBRC 16205]